MSETTDRRAAQGIRRYTIDLPARSTERLERLKELTDASSYGEVVRAGLRAYERELAIAAQIKADEGRN